MSNPVEKNMKKGYYNHGYESSIGPTKRIYTIGDCQVRFYS